MLLDAFAHIITDKFVISIDVYMSKFSLRKWVNIKV